MSKAAHTPTPWYIEPWSVEEDRYLIMKYDDVVARDVSIKNASFIQTASANHQELVTRLYNLVNAVETADKDDRTAGSIELRIEEARETLKKVIQ